jgi:hypothetical protein
MCSLFIIDVIIIITFEKKTWKVRSVGMLLRMEQDSSLQSIQTSHGTDCLSLREVVISFHLKLPFFFTD